METLKKKLLAIDDKINEVLLYDAQLPDNTWDDLKSTSDSVRDILSQDLLIIESNITDFENLAHEWKRAYEASARNIGNLNDTIHELQIELTESRNR